MCHVVVLCGYVLGEYECKIAAQSGGVCVCVFGSVPLCKSNRSRETSEYTDEAQFGFATLDLRRLGQRELLKEKQTRRGEECMCYPSDEGAAWLAGWWFKGVVMWIYMLAPKAKSLLVGMWSQNAAQYNIDIVQLVVLPEYCSRDRQGKTGEQCKRNSALWWKGTNCLVYKIVASFSVKNRVSEPGNYRNWNYRIYLWN